MRPIMNRTPHRGVVSCGSLPHGLFTFAFRAILLASVVAMLLTALGSETIPAVSSALVASTLAKALALTYEADRDKFLTPPNLKMLVADVKSARTLWARTQRLLEECRIRRINLEPALVERAEVGHVIFLKRFGPIGPNQAVERLVTISRRFHRSSFQLDTTIAWFANEAWTQHRQGYAQRMQADGKLSKPQLVGGGRRDHLLARKYYRISVRYALRAAKLRPDDPNVGWLFWATPLPKQYRSLSIWGACLFLVRQKEAAWWCYEDFYSPKNLQNVDENVRLNLKVLEPRALAAIRAGVWKNPMPAIPAWAEMNRALSTLKPK